MQIIVLACLIAGYSWNKTNTFNGFCKLDFS